MNNVYAIINEYREYVCCYELKKTAENHASCVLKNIHTSILCMYILHMYILSLFTYSGYQMYKHFIFLQ